MFFRTFKLNVTITFKSNDKKSLTQVHLIQRPEQLIQLFWVCRVNFRQTRQIFVSGIAPRANQPISADVSLRIISPYSHKLTTFFNKSLNGLKIDSRSLNGFFKTLCVKKFMNST